MRGRRLWEAYEGRVDGDRGLVLLEEACRTADRLDRLDALLSGDVRAWLTLAEDKRDEGTLIVKVDGVLAEARQQQGILHRILTSLPMRESDDGDPADAWLAGLVSPAVRDSPGSGVPDVGSGGGAGR